MPSGRPCNAFETGNVVSVMGTSLIVMADSNGQSMSRYDHLTPRRAEKLGLADAMRFTNLTEVAHTYFQSPDSEGSKLMARFLALLKAVPCQSSRTLI